MIWLRSHAYLLTFMLLGLGLCLPAVTRPTSDWEQVYVPAARRLVNGDDLYRLRDGYLYPPFQAMLAVPFTPLPRIPLRLVWHAVNILALGVLIRSAWRLSGGQPFVGLKAPRREQVVFLLGLACGFPFVLDALANQQTDILIATALFLGCLSLRSGATWRAGIWLGLAAAAKCTPLLFAPYLVWRRHWLTVGVMIVAAVVVNMLPNLISEPPSGGLWLVEWKHRYLNNLARRDHLPGVWGSEAILNQSLAGAVQRWSATELRNDAQGLRVVGIAPISDPMLLKGIVYGLSAMLLVLSFCAMGHRSINETGDLPPAMSLEVSLILTLMLLLSPMSSKPHFLILLLPGFCLARLAVDPTQGSRIAIGALTIGVLLSLGKNKDLITRSMSLVMLWCGAVTGAALALGVGCGLVLRQRRVACRSSLQIETMPPVNRQAA